MLLDRLKQPETKWEPKKPAEPVAMKDAYAELSVRAFATWVRLHTCTPMQLHSGRTRLSRSLGVSESQFNRTARELTTKGYLVIDSRANRNRSVVRLTKRARVGGANLFLNM